MSRRKPQVEEATGVPEYMTTYGDMVTLLLCFFVLLFAFSTIDAKKFQAIMQSFEGSAGILKSGKTLDESQFVASSNITERITNTIKETKRLKALKKDLEEYLEDNNLENQIKVELDDRGLVLRFDDNVLFDSGRAELRQQAKETLSLISSDFLKQEELAKNLILVEGHTDSDPIKRRWRFPTNWELSTARAVNVARFFIEETNINPQRISAAGYSKYHPVAPNDTPENKAKNRRVDIVIMSSDYLKN